jgi:hypothetical protein
MKKRCEITRDGDGWQVSFFPGEGLPPLMRLFEREDQALLAVSEWCGTQRERGYDIVLLMPPPDAHAER